MASLLDRTVDLASQLWLRDATAAEVERLGPSFTRIALEGEALRGVSWTPGAKVQVHMGGLTYRTYTPTAWDPDAGTTELLACDHGDGPGSAWVRTVAPGDPVGLFGPRGSLGLDKVSGRTIVVGDETSIALAVALGTVAAAEPVERIFEATDPDATVEVLAAVGLDRATVVPVGARDDLTAVLLDRLDAPGSTTLVLTGDQATVKHVRAALRAADVRPARTLAKAYWAEGRTGLD